MAHFDASAVRPEAWMPQIGTLSGNPIAAVAGLATVEILRRPGTYERMHSIGGAVKEALRDCLDRAEIPARVVGEGVLFDVFFSEHDIVDYRSTLLSDKEKLARFNRLLRERGVFKGDSKFYLSTAHDESDVELTVEAIESAVDELSG